jgi:hypothetical protein
VLGGVVVELQQHVEVVGDLRDRLGPLGAVLGHQGAAAASACSRSSAFQISASAAFAPGCADLGSGSALPGTRPDALARQYAANLGIEPVPAEDERRGIAGASRLVPDWPGTTGDNSNRRIRADVVIQTPDRRLRVFVSSTVGEAGELAAERRAVSRAISALRLTPVLFEAGARPYPPRAVPGLPGPERHLRRAVLAALRAGRPRHGRLGAGGGTPALGGPTAAAVCHP